MRVLAISGSLREGSYNTLLLRAATAGRPVGVEVELFNGLAKLPPYNEDLDVPAEPAEVRALREAIINADALLIATPEYNSSIPGHLKTALDWASRPTGAGALAGKPVAVIGASTGSFGGVLAQDDLRKVLRTTGARVVPETIAVPHAGDAFDDSGRLRRHGLAGQLQTLFRTMIREYGPDHRLAA